MISTFASGRALSLNTRLPALLARRGDSGGCRPWGYWQFADDAFWAKAGLRWVNIGRCGCRPGHISAQGALRLKLLQARAVRWRLFAIGSIGFSRRGRMNGCCRSPVWPGWLLPAPPGRNSARSCGAVFSPTPLNCWRQCPGVGPGQIQAVFMPIVW